MSKLSRPCLVRTAILLAAGSLVLSGCSSDNGAPTVKTDSDSAAVNAGEASDPGRLDGDPDPESEDDQQVVDVAALEASTADLGAFPYFDTSVPQGVTLAVDEEDESLTSPIWDGKELREIKGRTYQWVVPTNTDSALSDEDVRSRIDAAFTGHGGTLVTRSYLSDEALDAVNDTYLDSEVGPGLGDIMNQPVATYVVKQENKMIWLQSVANALQTSVIVVEEAAS